MINSNIDRYLKSLAEETETIYYCPNCGNAGDSLIAYSTFQLFNKNNVNYRIFNSQTFEPAEKILVYGGGGNLVQNHHGYARKIIQRYHRLVKKLIILPHTISTHEDLLKELGSNVEIICREEISYNHVKKHATKANVMLMDDLAFSLDIKDIFSKKPKSKILENIALKAYYKLNADEKKLTSPSPQRIIKSWIFETQDRLSKKSIKDNYQILNCFRIDAEKTDLDIPKDNIDLSMEFAYGTGSEKTTLLASYKLLNYMNQYQEIRTNRLHLAIGGALLGKTVKFYGNNYYKCRAIYQYSMKNKFSNVRWMG